MENEELEGKLNKQFEMVQNQLKPMNQELQKLSQVTPPIDIVSWFYLLPYNSLFLDGDIMP